jgi:hypothetical protein
MVLACASPQQGERCNPLAFSDNNIQGDCDTGLACLYPTAPNCGVAYCCKVDANGTVVDKSPNCQFDPSLVGVCMLDLASAPSDAGP